LNEVDLTALGLPADGHVAVLAYDESSASTVVTIEERGKVSGLLYVKRNGEREYQQIYAPDGHYLHYKLISAATGLAYVIIVPESRSGGMLGVLELAGRTLRTVKPKQESRPNERMWILSLIGVSRDADHVIVQAGYGPESPHVSFTAVYRICKMNVYTGELHELREVTTPFA
jgi:hypothetical protein